MQANPFYSLMACPGNNNFNITLQCFLLCLRQPYLFGFELKSYSIYEPPLAKCKFAPLIFHDLITLIVFSGGYKL
jgi:hypothetical protein